MADKGVSVIEQKEEAKKRKKEKEIRDREERNAWLVPLIVLIVVNIIFLSLDARAYQAVYKITNQNAFLAILTILASGGLAMLAWDVTLPHSVKHDNVKQRNISFASAGIGIVLSGVLAFADYIVTKDGAIDSQWYGGLILFVVLSTVMQGLLLAYWWYEDNHIKAIAKINTAHAEAKDNEDNVSVLETYLKSITAYLDKLAIAEQDYGRETVAAVAKSLGVVLPAVEDVVEKKLPPLRDFSKDISAIKPQDQRDDEEDPTRGGANRS